MASSTSMLAGSLLDPGPHTVSQCDCRSHQLSGEERPTEQSHHALNLTKPNARQGSKHLKQSVIGAAPVPAPAFSGHGRQPASRQMPAVLWEGVLAQTGGVRGHESECGPRRSSPLLAATLEFQERGTVSPEAEQTVRFFQAFLSLLSVSGILSRIKFNAPAWEKQLRQPHLLLPPPTFSPLPSDLSPKQGSLSFFSQKCHTNHNTLSSKIIKMQVEMCLFV